MIIPTINCYVGESIPIRYSFLQRLRDFHSTNQTLDVASIAWTSQTPALAAFVAASQGLITSSQGSAEGITNDGVIGRFTMVAAGRCTVNVSVAAINPTATYVGVIQMLIEAVPTP